MCYNNIMSGTKVEITQKAYSRPEEPANFITYALAAVLSFVGLVFLLLKSSDAEGLTVFAAALSGALPTVVFAVGALAHILPSGGKLRAAAQRADRAAIALLTVGAFAPIFLVGLARGTNTDAVWGYSLFSVAICAAVSAEILGLADAAEYKIFCLALYVTLGLVCAAKIGRVVELCGWDCFWTLFGGSVMYIAGIVLCAIEGLPARHTLRHLFVMGGAALHFVCIYSFVL